MLEKAKVKVKEEKVKNEQSKKLSPMDELLSDPEVKKTARYLVKSMPQAKARETLNELLEEEGRLPVTKSGKTVKITYMKFKTLLPKPRKKRAE